MRRLVYYICFCLSLVTCSPDSSRPCIPEDKMVEILTDQYIMQSAFVQKGAPTDDLASYYFNNLLENHHVTEAEFDSAIVWYTAHLDVYEKLYDKVIDRLKAKEDSLVPLVAAEASEENSDKKEE